MPRDRALGEFEHHVLLALLNLGGRSHGAPVVIALEAATGRDVSPAAVFIALRRLEERGFVSSRKKDPRPGEGGRGRRVFQVTSSGVARLRESRRAFEKLWSQGPLAELS
jgi:PadR family transcriptional regulator, regulatory protein PadR